MDDLETVCDVWWIELGDKGSEFGGGLDCLCGECSLSSGIVLSQQLLNLTFARSRRMRENVLFVFVIAHDSRFECDLI